MSNKLKGKAGVAFQLKEQEAKTQKFKYLNHKIKNKEELTKEEIQEYHEMTKNTKMEKTLQSNEWVIDSIIRDKFEDAMYYDIFVARCRDTGEPITVDKAKYFKEEILSLNKGMINIINCCSMKLGISAISSLCKYAKSRKVCVSNIVVGYDQYSRQRYIR